MSDQPPPSRPPPGPCPLRSMAIGYRLEVSAVLTDGEAVDKLIKALTATKALLPEKATKPENHEAAN